MTPLRSILLLACLLLAPLAVLATARGLEPLRRVEYFRIDWTGAGPLPAARAEISEAEADEPSTTAVAYACWRRIGSGAAAQLESEVVFPREGLRIFAVEDLDRRDPRLVWRELSRGGGRTVHAEWAPGSEGLRIREWGRDGCLRESLYTRQGIVLPQYLLELARHGRLTMGSFLVFDPISRTLERLSVQTSYSLEGEGGAAGAERLVELRRSDGSLAGRYRFQKAELVGFQWQESELVATRIDEDAYLAATAD